jgi:sulfite exporter TauE/SafE
MAMALFGAGTLPAMVLFGLLSRGVSDRMRGARGLWLRRGAGAVLASFGVMSLVFVALSFRSAGSRSEDVHCVPEAQVLGNR